MATREPIQVFVPEGNRDDKSIPVDLHDRWVIRILGLCADLFGGATCYGRGVGVWTGPSRRHWERVTVIEAWYDPSMPYVASEIRRLERRLLSMAIALRQEAVAAIISGDFWLIHSRGAR